MMGEVIQSLLGMMTVEDLTYQQQIHVFLATITVIVNEPAVAVKHKETIDKIVNQLLESEVIYDDNILVQYKSYEEFAGDFLAQDYVTQNDAIQFDKRTTQ